MDYCKSNTIHTIYYPNNLQSPTNQRTFYSNNVEIRLCEIEEYYKAMNDRHKTENDKLNRRLVELQCEHLNITVLHKKIRSELSQQKYSQNKMKDTLTKRLEDIESLITKNLNSFIMNQRKRNQMLLSKIVNLEEDVMQEFHPIKEQQKALSEELFKRIEVCETKFLEELDSATDKQEDKNSRLYDQLEQVKELLDLHGSIIKQDLQPHQEKLRITTDQIQDKMLQHESIIREEVQPFLKEIQEALSNPIANLLKKLTPGTLIKQLTVNGTVFEVIYFLDFDIHSNLATFLIEGKIGSINTTRIDSLTFG